MTEPRDKAVTSNPDHPGLKRNELTPQGKRDHLTSVGIKGEDADKIIDKLYKPEGLNK